MVTYSSGSKHKPCRFNPDGATREYCKEVSALPIRQQQGCNACGSPYKCKPAPVAAAVRAVPSRPSRTELRTGSSSVDASKRHVALAAPKQPALSQTPPAAAQATVTALALPSPAVLRLVTPESAQLMPANETVSETGHAEEKEPFWRSILKRIQVGMAESEYRKIPSRLIRPMAGQPREFFDDAALARLEMSVREVGQIQTGLVRRIVPDENGCEYELLDGERRWRVVSKIGEADYRAMLVQIDDEAAPFVVATIANFNRADHTPLELANAIHRLRTGLKMPMETIADMHGIKPFWAYQIQGLMNLHADVRDLLDPRIMKDKECMPVTAAVHISKLDRELQPDLSRRFMAGEITLRGLRAEVLRLGNEHGAPVRQRKQNTTHQFDSFVAMGQNLYGISSDLKALCNRRDFKEFIRSRNAEKVANVQQALNRAEDQIFLCKQLIAQALSDAE